jgi:hypothetical protein
MKLISLTQNKFTKVDDQDYDWLMQWKWNATHRISRFREGWYAGRIGPRPERRGIYMHREIAAILGFAQVDHYDNDGLNNQRYNLRQCTAGQNSANRRKSPGLSSQYKGVCQLTNQLKFVAYICVSGQQIRLGTFDDEVEAAHAYDAAATLHFGTFAKLNFPETVLV